MFASRLMVALVAVVACLITLDGIAQEPVSEDAFGNVYTLGPGGIPYQPGLTMERAISLGGGFTPRASKTKVKVLREADPNAEAQPIRSNDPVYPGDVITVPERFF